jgi:poly(A) polymerase
MPQIYKKSEHKITKDKIDPAALIVTETLKNAGYTAYIVGGSVRDLLLGKPPQNLKKLKNFLIDAF